MIQVPVEIFVWLGGAIFAMFTVCAHLLINLNGKLTTIAAEQGLQAAEMRFLKQLYTQGHAEGS